MILSRNELLKALRAASGIVPSRTPRSSLREALIERVGDEVRLLASDLGRGIDVPVPGDANAGEALMLPIAEACAALATVSGERASVYSLEPGRVVIECDGARWSWASSLPADANDSHRGPTNEMPLVASVDGAALDQALAQVEWAIATEATRYCLNWLQLLIRGGEVSARATDGKCAAVTSFKVEDAADAEVLVEPATMRALLATTGAGKVALHVRDGSIRVVSGGAKGWALGLNSQFPPLDSFLTIPNGLPRALVDAAQFRGACQRAALATDKTTSGLDLTLEPGDLARPCAVRVSFTGADKQAVGGVVPAKSDSPSAKACIDARYLASGLAGLDGPTTFCFGSGGSANFILNEKRPKWMALLMGIGK